jgi:N6-L-threonylcarbamoyladenine synthase
MIILGIETTCDETAAAVVRDGREVLSSVVASQTEIHAKFGGVVPEIASRAHLECINAIVGEALERAGVSGKDLDAIAVANSPGLIGCLLIGVSAAKGFAFAWSKPLVAVNHVQAHLYSVMLRESGQWSAGGRKEEPQLPAIGLVISGGHSSMYHVRAFDDLVRIGSTHDDAVGEAFDKVAAILQLGYPGGPLIDALAKEGDSRAVDFPVSYLGKESLDFSFSGLKTAVLYHVNGKKGRERDASLMSHKQKADVAASFQRVAARILIEKLRRAVSRFEARSIIVGGGVSANSEIRLQLLELGEELDLPVFVPPMRYCTDNGAMIAGLAYPLLQAGKVADLSVDAVATT